MVSQPKDDEEPAVTTDPDDGDPHLDGSVPPKRPSRRRSLRGTRIGDWTIQETVGHGGMGIVYRATHDLIEGDFAVKMLRPELAADDAVLQRFLSEVQKARLLDHPNIVRMEIPFRHDDSIFLPMEMLRGRTLGELIDDEPGPWPIDRIIDHLGQAAAGLGHAHGRSVLHRDVKPENLFVTATGRVKLLDFGLAKRIGDQSLTARGLAVGTPVYMAPEVLRGEKPGTPADVYSLGMILFRLLTGQLPIPIQDTAATLAELFGPVLHAHERGLPRPSTFQPGIPEWLDELSARLLDQDPTSRPQNGNEVARILELHPTRADGSQAFDNPFASTPGDARTATGDIMPHGSGVHPRLASSGGALGLAPPTPQMIAPTTSDIPITSGGWPVPTATADLLAPTKTPRWAAIALASIFALGLAFVAIVIFRPPDPTPPSPTQAATAAAPTAPPLTAGRLIAFSSEPPGAFVTVEGKVLCKATPCSGRVEPGHRYVTMRLDRYGTFDQVVEITKSTPGVHATLEPMFGRLTVSSHPPGVTIAVDGELWGPTPVTGRELAPGKHSIEILDRRFRRTVTTVRVDRAATRRINLRPKPIVNARAEDFDAFFDLDVPPATPVSGGGVRKAP